MGAEWDHLMVLSSQCSTYNYRPLDLQLLISRPTTPDLSPLSPLLYCPLTPRPSLSCGLIISLHNSHPFALLAFICKKLQVFELQLLIRFEVEWARW